MGIVKFTSTVFLFFACTLAFAVEWDIEPSIEVGETYTDNILLDPDGFEDDEFVTEIKPELKLRASGKKFEAEFDYRLQGLLYSQRDELNEVLNYSNLNGKAQLVGDSLFLNFDGALSQQIVSPEGRIGISGITPGRNRSEVGRFNIRPYFSRKIGRNSNINIAYRYGLVEYDDVSLVDSENKGINFVLSGSPPRAAWAWRINGSNNRIDYDSGSRVDLQRVGGELSWSFGKTAAFVEAGDEDNNFNQLVGSRKIDGSYWSVGLRGQLDRLTEYSFSAGKQHFGDSYDFSLNRRAGKLLTDISYLEETTTIGQQQQGYEALFEFLSNITGVELPTPGAEVYVRKRFSAVGTLLLARSRVRLNAYNEDRTYLTTFFGGDDGVT
ncbi:MAG: TIGR03016 family PEP-CTERM system-associated outer membrane protein, partial [Gammaproteobacteria bacterium]|nr:TIGR03016 family PEP-CTERM system-associated outer membrane protein [Gammaproteobacteria bacterium]